MTRRNDSVRARRFTDPHSRTADYERVVDALLALSVDDATRAYAEATAERRRRQFLNGLGWRERTENICIRQLHGKRCNHELRHSGPVHLWPESRSDDDYDWCLPAGADHTSVLTGDGKVQGIYTQPYDLAWEEMQWLVRYCEANGLRADLEGWSWHFPGRTLGLMLKPAEGRQLFTAFAEDDRD